MTVIDEQTVRRFDRLPPRNIDAEAAVLGSMALDPGCIPCVRALLSRNSFFQADHQVIFDVLCDMADADRPVDAILLRAEINRRGLLEEVGGTQYLAQVLDSVPTAAHAEHFAREVRECETWRAIIRECQEAERDAYAPHRGLGAAAERARRAADVLSECSVEGTSDGFRRAGEVAGDVFEQLNRGEKRFIPTGLRDLDAVIGGVRIGGMTLVGGRPGMGKSQTARQIAHNVARSGMPAAIVTVEETDEKIAGNLLSATSGVRNSRIMHGTVLREDFDALAFGLEKLDKLPIWINDKPVTLSDVVAAVTIAATKYRCRVVVVDYLQLIDAQVSGENENREITLVSRALKAAFKRLDVAGVVAVQLNRGNEGQGGSSVRLPQLRDLRGSGSLEQDGDTIVLLHRNDYYRKEDQPADHQIQAVIAKNKGGDSGTVPLRFDGDTQTVSDWDGGDASVVNAVRHFRPATASHENSIDDIL